MIDKMDQFQKDWDKFDFTDMPEYIKKADLYIEMTASERELDKQKKEMVASKSSKSNMAILNEKRKQDKLQAASKEAMVVEESETA